MKSTISSIHSSKSTRERQLPGANMNSLANTLAYKWGYGDDIETFKKEASDKFSLLKDGTLDKPTCARLLLVNGTEDEIFPIDDCYLALQHGAPKEAR